MGRQIFQIFNIILKFEKLNISIFEEYLYHFMITFIIQFKLGLVNSYYPEQNQKYMNYFQNNLRVLLHIYRTITLIIYCKSLQIFHQTCLRTVL